MRRYIGITGFTHPYQVEQMLEVRRQVTRTRAPTDRELHVGVMMSHKTLHGIPTKWSTLFPRNEALPLIFYSDEAYNCLHYADYDVADPEVARSIWRGINFCGDKLHGLQLDMIWPDPKQIAAITRRRPGLEIILQLGKHALEKYDNDPKQVSQALVQYQYGDFLLSRVLIDMSMGRGEEMKPEFTLSFIERIANEYPALGIVVAGGLGPDTLHLLDPILEVYPNVSFDAQGKLCFEEKGHNPTDWTVAAKYLEQGLIDYY